MADDRHSKPTPRTSTLIGAHDRPTSHDEVARVIQREARRSSGRALDHAVAISLAVTRVVDATPQQAQEVTDVVRGLLQRWSASERDGVTAELERAHVQLDEIRRDLRRLSELDLLKRRHRALRAAMVAHAEQCPEMQRVLDEDR